MRILSLALAFAFLGCTGDKPAEVDADPRGPTCTKALYDLCATEHDCVSTNCRPFTTEGFRSARRRATPSDPSTCPQPSGATATCDATTSLCVPSAPNHCHLL